MKEYIRNNIFMCLEGRIEQYVENIDINFRNDNKDAMTVWINQIQALLDFVDGKNIKVMKNG